MFTYYQPNEDDDIYFSFVIESRKQCLNSIIFSIPTNVKNPWRCPEMEEDSDLYNQKLSIIGLYFKYHGLKMLREN